MPPVSRFLTRRKGLPLFVASCLALSLMAGFPAGVEAQAKSDDKATRLTLSPVFEPADTGAGNFLAALIAGANRDTAAAALYTREALRSDPRNSDLVERTFEAQLADGNMNEALRLAKRILDRDTRHGLARTVLAAQAIKAGQFQTARALLAPGARNRTADMTATLLTAWAHAGSKEAPKAFETLTRLKGEDAVGIFRTYHGGLIADLLGRKQEAETRLKQAFEDAGRRPLRLVDAYGRVLARRGALDEARTLYEDYNQRVTRHPSVTQALKEIGSGQAPAALVSSAQAGAAEVFYGLGSEGGRQGDEIAAIIYLRLAQYLDPEHDLATMSLAEVYERLKHYAKAIEIYDMIDKDSPFRVSADVQVGFNLEAMGKKDEAASRMRKAATESPKDIEILSALGNILRANKKYAESAEVFSQAIAALDKVERNHWTLFYFRGTAYERIKQWDKAEPDFKKALELNPEQPEVLNYLGYSWVDMNMNLDQAFGMLKRAVELRPRDGYIVDSLGWAYYRLGQFEDAVRELERAVLLKPSDPTINDHLGDAYWRVGRKLEASFQWSHARDLKPEPEELEKILRKLEKGLEEPAKPAAAGVEDKPADHKPNGG